LREVPDLRPEGWGAQRTPSGEGRFASPLRGAQMSCPRPVREASSRAPNTHAIPPRDTLLVPGFRGALTTQIAQREFGVPAIISLTRAGVRWALDPETGSNSGLADLQALNRLLAQREFSLADSTLCRQLVVFHSNTSGTGSYCSVIRKPPAPRERHLPTA